MTISVFFSYSHKDEVLRDDLANHLKILERAGVIRSWHDRRIEAGEDWKAAIDEHLASATVVLLLVSSDFLASDYCYDVEVKRALERHDAREATVIPVVLRSCKWNRAPFARLQALPKNAIPVTSWTNRDEAWTSVVDGIEKAIARIVNLHNGETNAHGGSPNIERVVPELAAMPSRIKQVSAGRAGITPTRNDPGKNLVRIATLFLGERLIEKFVDRLDLILLRRDSILAFAKTGAYASAPLLSWGVATALCIDGLVALLSVSSEFDLPIPEIIEPHDRPQEATQTQFGTPFDPLSCVGICRADYDDSWFQSVPSLRPVVSNMKKEKGPSAPKSCDTIIIEAVGACQHMLAFPNRAVTVDLRYDGFHPTALARVDVFPALGVGDFKRCVVNHLPSYSQVGRRIGCAGELQVLGIVPK